MEQQFLRPPDLPVSAVVVGAGAIGSHLLGVVVRSAGLGALTIIDRDTYTLDNRRSQNIHPADLGRPKARAQARRLREVRPDLPVRAIVGDIGSISLGRLRGDIIFACVDTRLARQFINQCAFRLGIPWVDAGVKGDDLLARVHVYSSRPEDPCLECAWSQRDYDLLEQAYPCQPETEPVPTNAPAALGALAASLQALEFEKWLGAGGQPVPVGQQVLVDAGGHRDRVTRFLRNDECRFDHHPWAIEAIDCAPGDITLGQAIELGRAPGSASGGLALAVDRKRFVSEVLCRICGSRKPSFHLEHPARRQPCDTCGAPVEASPIGLSDEIRTDRIQLAVLGRSLADLDFEHGDVFTVTSSAGERHFEICPSEVST